MCGPDTLPSTVNGGGLAILLPSDVQSPQRCSGKYWAFTHDWVASVADSVAAGNFARGSPLSSGGGLYLASGGQLVVTNSTFVANQAVLFGGGIALGNVGGGTTATCAAQLLGATALLGNLASHAAAQLYMACSADLLISDTQFALTTNATQVGQVTVEPVWSMQCVQVTIVRRQGRGLAWQRAYLQWLQSPACGAYM
jgi:hypothetical protein